MLVLILSLICSLLIAVFAVQNANLVTIQLLWVTKDVPLVLVILGSAFAGALIMLLLAIWRELRLKLTPKQHPKDQSLNNDLPVLHENSTLKSTDGTD
ncbi:LapA family protein [Desulfosporosinus sp.]|uniref:LapA family protein n=1 Tax=Desulfosporosinus sp. TaxID=157907 RepID=UPI00231A5255|nr:LapA family protein [Desulfosporosinus sp.]MCO5386372.1 LapA family protein [Desulfosporosinus sp.]MDA8223992.1 LapA family protein [Desulfitobacterium hafniense]